VFVTSICDICTRSHIVFSASHLNNPCIWLLLTTGNFKKGRSGHSANILSHFSALNCTEMELDLWAFCTQP